MNGKDKAWELRRAGWVRSVVPSVHTTGNVEVWKYKNETQPHTLRSAWARHNRSKR